MERACGCENKNIEKNMQNLHAAVIFSRINNLNSKNKYYPLQNILMRMGNLLLTEKSSFVLSVTHPK